MVFWSVVFLVAVAGVTADPEALEFPEIVRERSARIVSGWEAEEGQLPFQLSLRMVNPIGTVNACGGTIIHAEWGMTAAHCTATRVSFVIRAGAVNLTRPEILFETTEYYNHPLYNEALQSVVQPHDIGLLRFGRALVFSARVAPVRLQSSADRNRNYAGDRLIASGWGRTWTNGDAPENLNWVYLRGVSNFACFLDFGGSGIIVDSTICASGYNVTSQSTCQGDSGGPLTVVDDDGITSQVGVASFVSSTGCHTDFPAGFIRPGHYHDWYTEVSGIDFDWESDTVGTTLEPEEVETVAPPTTDEPEEVETVAPPTTDEPEEVETVAPPTTDEPEEVETVAPPTTDEPEEVETVAPPTTDEPEEVETVAPPTTDEPEEVETVAPPTTDEPEEVETVAPPTTDEPEEVETVAPPTDTRIHPSNIEQADRGENEEGFFGRLVHFWRRSA